MMRVLLVALLLVLGGCMVDGTKKKEVDESQVLDQTIGVAVGYVRQGDYARAKDHLNRALQMDRNSARAHTTLGIVFQLEEENDLAEKHFKEAIRLSPESAPARNNYGAFLFASERYAEAVEQLAVAATDRFYPNRPQVFENLGICYNRMGEFVKAEESFVRAVELNPSQPRALLELAEIRYGQGAYADSEFYFERYETLARQSARGAWLCVRLSHALGDKNREASCTLTLRNLYPSSDEYRQYREWQR